MRSITFDTCLWVKLIDKKDKEEILELLEHCKINGIQIHSSSRLFTYDTTKIDGDQRSGIQ